MNTQTVIIVIIAMIVGWKFGPKIAATVGL